MFKSAFVKSLTLSTIMVGAFSVAQTSYASGSFNPSSANNEQRVYGIGKQVFHKKLVCESCPLGGKTLDRSVAKMTIENISNRSEGYQHLKSRERRAAILYLKKRYRIR